MGTEPHRYPTVVSLLAWQIRHGSGQDREVLVDELVRRILGEPVVGVAPTCVAAEIKSVKS